MVDSLDLLRNPPSGCSVHRCYDGMKGEPAVEVRISLASIGGFLLSAAIAIFWNGIVGVFVSIAVAGLYFNLIGPVPAWFPAVGVEEGVPIMNDKPMGPGMTLVVWLFLTPFLLLGLAFTWGALLSLAGQQVVRVAGAASYAAQRIGPVALKDRFNAAEIESVDIVTKQHSHDGHRRTSCYVELTGKKSVTLGVWPSRERRQWLRAVLRELLFKPREEWRCRID